MKINNQSLLFDRIDYNSINNLEKKVVIQFVKKKGGKKDNDRL